MANKKEVHRKRLNILALLGFIFSFFTPLAGIIMSVVALIEIEEFPGKWRGRGLAIAGIAISILGIILPFIFILAGFSYFGTIDPAALLS